MNEVTRRSFTTGSLAAAALASLGGASGAGAAEFNPKIIGEKQDKIVISGGVDVVALNGLDIVPIVPDRLLMSHISDTLIRAGKSGKLIPWLATSWRNVDPVTWELTLRRNVLFQNGEKFDARAVKAFYAAMNDPKNLSPSKSNHSWVARVDIVDDYTVHIVSREPYPVAPSQISMAHMIPPDYLAKVGYDGYRKAPIGCGPYRLTEYVRDDHVTLEAFDGWWAGAPRIKTIIWRPIKEDAARVSALLAGEIDLAFDVPPELIPLIKRDATLHVKNILSSRVYVLFLNTINPADPTCKREVREAINCAIDRDSLNRNILASTGAPAAWLNPKSFGANPDLKPIAYDPDRARKLLAAAGYPNGIDVVLDSPQGRFIKDKELAEAIAGQLAKVGIRAQATTYEWGVFTKRMWSHQSSPIVLMAWVDTLNDPDVQNNRILLSGGTWSQNADPKLDALMASIKTEMNPDKRKALILKQQDYMRETFPIAYLLQMGIVCGTSAKLSWWEPRPNDAHQFYRLSDEG
jgi:peptide/nickel transport system substrate-binding protein